MIARFNPAVALSLSFLLVAVCSPQQADAQLSTVLFDGFGDADINNVNGPFEDVDTDVAGTAPLGNPDTYVPARLEDAEGNGPENLEVTAGNPLVDSSDTGIRWIQSRGFTGGSSTAAGAGQSKPTIRIVDDTQGAMLETQGGPNGLGIAAIDSGLAMSWESRGGGSSALGFFDQNVALGPDVGDEVKVSFDFRFWRDAPNANTNLEPFGGELRFGLFQDTNGHIGETNPFAGRQVEDDFGFLQDVPAVFGQDEGLFEGSLTGNRGPGDDVGTDGARGWTASVVAGQASPGLVRLREEVQADRLLQGTDTQTIAAPENLNPDPFGVPIFDFPALENDKVYNLSLSLVRDTVTDPGDTITTTLTILDVATEETWTLSGTEMLENHTSGGEEVPDTGGVQSDNWDYFAIRNATSGVSEFDFILDNFLLESSTAGPTLMADFNGDGTVDLLDLDILGTNFGLDPATMAQGDANGDGVVNLLDLDILGTEFGMSAASAVPEPTAAVLLLSVAIAGVAQRRRVI